MALENNIQVELRREDIEDLIEEIEREASRHKKKLEMDARVLGRLHTFYGHNRPSAPVDIVGSAFRRTNDILRGV